MGDYLRLKRASEITGLCGNTLRKYADNGTIPSYRLPNGDRRFDVSGLCNQRQSVICYARVSATKQKEDLRRQSEALSARHKNAEIVKDTGSGLNYKRKGLKTILERAVRGERIILVVTHRDRLARFGFELIEWIISLSGGKVIVLNQLSTSPVEELTRDLAAIITVFSSRLRGLRSHKNKNAIAQAINESKGNSA